MTTEAKTEATQVETKPNDKEYNFRAQEAKYERILANEKAERERLQREIEEIKRAKTQPEEEDDDSEPYVDKKRLEKTLKRFGQSTQSEIQNSKNEAINTAKEQLREEMWLESHPDFYQTLQTNAEKFMERAPQLAEAILKMPDNFERKKLVYHNIKSMGIDKAEQKQQSMQEKIDSNRKNLYYQPSGVANTPYAAASDFSDSGKKNAYEQMQKLKANLRLG